ncbi:MAG: hypothetical protein JRN15_20840 [Nitrososphaerota archaeon]|nr:hypothetical protein [Nitrososphaerota archaeon]
MKESDMYKPVKVWLEGFLRSRFRSKWKVQAEIAGHVELSSVLERIGVSKLFPESACYKVKVDVVGILQRDAEAQLALVECKDEALDVMALSQALGYSRIVRPLFSFLVSPFGLSPPVNSLLKVYRRYDILEYYQDRRLVLAKWSMRRGDIDYNSINPAGAL